MQIINKKLTNDGIIITINDPTEIIESIYLSNIDSYDYEENKVSHYDIVPEFSQDQDIITIKAPEDTPTLCIITIISSNDEQIVDLFLNEFSVFKAKTDYLHIISCNDSCNNNCNTCYNCSNNVKILNILMFFIRLNLLHQTYMSNNIDMSIKLYKDLKRHKNLDIIPFKYINLNSDYYKNPGKLHELFFTLNKWVKHNSKPCQQKLLDCLLLGDLYDIIFQVSNNDGRPEWILEDHVWNMDREFWFCDGIWKN